MCVSIIFYLFFFKQKTAYEMRISDWSSDVCSSDLYESEMIAKADMDAHIASPLYHGGIHDGQGGHFHPLNYAIGLAKAAEAAEIGRASCRERVCQYV